MDNLQLKLFLWPRGLFPRRIAYQLLMQELVESPKALLSGKAAVPNISLNISTLGPSGFEDSDPTDPKPAGYSSPCLRVTDTTTGKVQWIRESSAISYFLAEAFPSRLPLQGESLVDRAAAADMVYLINLMAHDSSYYVRHASAAASSWSGVQNEDRSLPAALDAKTSMLRSLQKLQSWSLESLQTTGWLTPGIQHPGLVDVSLAAILRYLGLVYELDFLEDDTFEPLRGWWAKFKTVPWWHKLEEEGEVHPPSLRYGKQGLDV